MRRAARVREVACRARELEEEEAGWKVQWRVEESWGKRGNEAVPGRGRGEIGEDEEDNVGFVTAGVLQNALWTL